MRELELLQHIYGANAGLPGRVTVPPGDDAACVRLGGRDLLITVDQVADGVHVDVGSTPLEKVARKAVTRNLSDIAAMAGVPVAAVAAVSLPRGFGQERAERLFDAMSGVGAAYGCPLVGGDTSVWDHPLLISVTVVGEPTGVGPVTRRGARMGDAVCVTGRLGGSGKTVNGYTHHLDFEPRLSVARKLAMIPGVTLRCMIDLSDGLAMDLPRLCELGEGNGVGAELWSGRLPISEAAQAAAEEDGRPAWEHALADGEDYELCFTLPAAQVGSALPREIEGVPVTQIGVVVPREGGPMVRLKTPDGSVQPVERAGWEHHD